MATERSERRLAAIMFTDIVGYTALMAESEQRGHRVRARQAAILRPLVEQYGGDWVQQVGDETLASFPSAMDGVNCALAIQAALKDELELHVRIGIHLGEIVPASLGHRGAPWIETITMITSTERRSAAREKERIQESV